MLVKMVRNISHTLLMGTLNGMATLQKSFAFPTNINIKLLYGPAIAIFGIYLREIKIYIHIKAYLNVHSNFVCNNQKLKSAQMTFIGKWLMNWYIHPLSYCSMIEKNELYWYTQTIWMTLQRIMLSGKESFSKDYILNYFTYIDF